MSQHEKSKDRIKKEEHISTVFAKYQTSNSNKNSGKEKTFGM